MPTVKYQKLSTASSEEEIEEAELELPASLSTTAKFNRLHLLLLVVLALFSILFLWNSNRSTTASWIAIEEPNGTAIDVKNSTTLDSIEVVPEIGALSAQDSLQLAVVPSSATMSVNLQLKSHREACTSGDCIFRVYLSGSSKLGSYFYYQAPFYVANLTVAESGKYSVLVILEAIHNATKLPGHLDASVIYQYPHSYRFTSAERISATNTIVDIQLEPSPQQKDPQAYQQLPPCRYSIDDIEKNNFQWIQRNILLDRHFGPNDTLMLPSERLDPTGNSVHFAAEQHKFPWFQPYQHYVWHSSTCKQPYIQPKEVRSFARKQGGIHVIVVGTSRLRDVYTQMKTIAQKDEPNKDITFSFVMNSLRNSTPAKMYWQLQGIFKTFEQCTEAEQTKDAPALVILLSHGIWEAVFSAQQGPFEFASHAEASIRSLYKRCAKRRLRIILMTNPTTQPFDGKNALQDKFATSTYAGKQPIAGTRLEIVNEGWKQMARKFQLPIVDAAAASFPRREECYDNIHYHLVDKATNNVFLKVNVTRFDEKQEWKFNGNAVSHTFAQLAYAAMLQLTF